MRKAIFLVAASQLVFAGAVHAQTTTTEQTATPTDPTAATSATGQTDTAAQADTATPAAPPSAGGDIVVTARRRNENLQDVPLSITAVSGAALTARGVRDAIDLQYQTPSLTVTANGASRNSVAYSIRGQRTQESQLLTDPPVGTYFAEVVQPRPFGFGTAFYDIQNVQVLKGVQGTLFGRNMTGGAVLVEPNHPDLSNYHAEAVGQYGNYNMVDVYGMVNLPVIKDVFGLRVAGKYRDRDGFTKDVSTGRDYDDQHYYAFRVSGSLDLGRFKSFTVFDYLKENEHGTALKLIGTALTDPLNGSPTVIGQQIGASSFFPVAAGAPPQNLLDIFQRDLALGRYKVNFGNVGNGVLDGEGGIPYNNIRNYGITNKSTFEAGPVTFKNIFGYRNVSYVNHSDYDGSEAALIFPTQFSYTHDYSEEFQMQGTPFGSRFQLTMGAYYFSESGSDGARPSTFPQLTAIGFATNPGLTPLFTGGAAAQAGYFLTLPGRSYVQSSVGYGLARSYAFYAAGTYSLTDAFKLSGGLRYNNDLRRATINTNDPYLTIPGLGTGFCVFNGLGTRPLADCAVTKRLKNDALTWDATIQYEPTPDLTTYASARRGYRAGGFNLRAQNDATFQPFQPETVNEYEVGLKKTFRFDGGARLTTNGAVFFQNYKNVQKQNAILVDNNIQTIVTNTAAQHDYGGEFEANLNLPNGLGANLFYSYVNNDIVKGGNGSYSMQGVPKHQVGGGLNYAHELDGVGSLNGNINATYRSSTPLDEFDAIGIQKGYAIVNARLGVDRIAGSNFGAAVFMNNVTGAYYKQGGNYLISNGPVIGGVNPGGGPGFAASTFGEPRTYGVELSARF